MKNANQVSPKQNTRIIRCTCKHDFQDERYGQNMRVHNAMLKPKPGWRCTVCLHVVQDE